MLSGILVNNGYKKSTKTLIVRILAYNFPLSIKQIVLVLKKEWGISISYTAVRKSILELVQAEILDGKNKKYQLNKKWINQTSNFISEVERNYNLKNNKPLKMEHVGKDTTVYTLNNIYSAEKMGRDIISKWINGLDEKNECDLTLQTCHPLVIFFHHGWEKYRPISQNKNLKQYLLIYSNTALDKIAVKLYDKLGVSTKTINDPSFSRGGQIITFCDTILQISTPTEIAKEMDDYCKTIRKVDDLDLLKLNEIAKRNVETTLTVFKNADIANQIRSSVIKHFSRTKK